VQADAHAREAVSGAHLLNHSQPQRDRAPRRVASNHDRVAEGLHFLAAVFGEQRAGLGVEDGGEVSGLLVAVRLGERREAGPRTETCDQPLDNLPSA
jgi:hypothetical protein